MNTVYKVCANCKVKTPGQTTNKPVVMIDKITNKIIQTFHSMMEAEKKTGINHGSIGQVCKGKRKTAGGYIWKFV